MLRVLTQTIESGGMLRLLGEGIDGGLDGAQRLAATVYRGAVPVLGACGEKDCQASNMGAETLGCASSHRPLHLDCTALVRRAPRLPKLSVRSPLPQVLLSAGCWRQRHHRRVRGLHACDRLL